MSGGICPWTKCPGGTCPGGGGVVRSIFVMDQRNINFEMVVFMSFNITHGYCSLLRYNSAYLSNTYHMAK